MLLSLTLAAEAATMNANWDTASDVPVTASSYTVTGNTVDFTLNFAPATGTNLTVVNNTGLLFINGTFDNLTQGQAVALSYDGVTYHYVANYYGGTGNDMVLVWANNRAFAWGYNLSGEMGDGTTTNRQLPTAVDSSGVLAGKTLVATASTGTVADAADFDHDGIPNLIEWACGLNPTTRSTLPSAMQNSGVNLEYTYTRSTTVANAGATFTVEWSDTLAAGSWTSSGVTQTVLSDDGTTQQVKAVIPVNTATKKFARLSVTAP